MTDDDTTPMLAAFLRALNHTASTIVGEDGDQLTIGVELASALSLTDIEAILDIARDILDDYTPPPLPTPVTVDLDAAARQALRDDLWPDAACRLTIDQGTVTVDYPQIGAPRPVDQTLLED